MEEQVEEKVFWKGRF